MAVLAPAGLLMIIECVISKTLQQPINVKPYLLNLKTSMPGDILTYGEELTMLVSCLGDCCSGVEAVGRVWVFSSSSRLLEGMGLWRQREIKCEKSSYSMCVRFRLLSLLLSVCIWMCLHRQPGLLFTQINIWHWLHGLWSAFHPIWTINVSALHQPGSVHSPQGTILFLANT